MIGGGRREIRTLTPLRALDSKSSAYTSFAIRPIFSANFGATIFAISLYHEYVTI